MARIERVVKGQTPSLLESSGVDPIIVKAGDNGKLTVSMDGYGPEEFIVCVNGSLVTRNFLTDNPD